MTSTETHLQFAQTWRRVTVVNEFRVSNFQVNNSDDLSSVNCPPALAAYIMCC